VTLEPSRDLGVGPAVPPEPLGHVLSVRGSEARIGLPVPSFSEDGPTTVGRFLGIRTGQSRIIGMITEVAAETSETALAYGCRAVARVDLMGQIRTAADGTPYFQRGVRKYPAIGDPAMVISDRELALIYREEDRRTITIGQLHQDESIAATVNVDDLVSKHFAVLGSTGVGKSSGVAVILREILAARPDLRILLLDGHNEYGRCFEARAHIVNARNLRLPFWMFNFEETVDVVYGGRPGVAEELEILAELIPIAKSMYSQYKSPSDRLGLKKVDPKHTGYTIDTPVPYLLQDLVSLIDERMGRLENRSSRMHYHRLMMRLETIRNDPRYAFIFENANVGGDTMGELLRQLFRLEPAGKPITVMQLAGLPVEVVDAVVCVLCRLAFDLGLWSDGMVPLLLVCEEAHRYASVERAVGFAPTRRALARIAKEGRKYAVYLGLVTQRPAELDPTIISQCSTLFAMRMANERDQALLRSSVSDAAANLLAFVPSLGTREVVAFGEGVPLPARLTFTELPNDLLPRSDAVGASLTSERGGDRDALKAVIDRWRGATMSHKPRLDDPLHEGEGGEPGPLSALRPDTALDPTRFRILKAHPDPAGAPLPTRRGA